MKLNLTLSSLLFCSVLLAQEKANSGELQKIASEAEKKYHTELSVFKNELTQVSGETRNDLLHRFAGYLLGGPVFYHSVDDNQALATNTDLLYDNSIPGVQVTGSGMKAYIWDGGNVRTTHVDLSGRITNKESVALSDHSTGVAGVVMGAGLASSGGNSSKGMAYQATLNSYDYNNNISEIANESAAPANVNYMVSNHSYGAVSGWAEGNYGMGNGWYWFGFPSFSQTESVYFGFYGDDDASLDEIAYNTPQHTIIKSAGNDNHEGPGTTLAQHWALVVSGGTSAWQSFNNVNRPNDCGQTGFDCIPTSSLAKNIITVGAVEVMNGRYMQPSDVVVTDFSSFGPADDGRIKPDVVAVGEDVLAPGATGNNDFYLWAGTSFSAPAVSGNILLLQQLYEQQFGIYLRSDLAKALVIHTAREAGDAPGPDYRFGWGLMDSAGAAELIMEKNETAIFENQTLSNGETFTMNVRGTENTPLKVTIVWLDPKSTAGTTHNERTPKLINDLDLRISDGLVNYYPWKLDVNNPSGAATTGDNILDNVEQIVIDNPTEGLNYKIRVLHKGNLQSGSQMFAIVVTGAAFCPETTIWNGSSWSNSIPDASTKAVIDGSLTLSSDLEACDIEITEDGSLTIPSERSLTVNGIVLNESNASDFIVENGANLIQNGTARNVGEIKVQRESNPMVRLDYTLWSSPVTGQNLFGFSPDTVNGVTNYPGSEGRIYIYDGTNGYVHPSPFTETAVFENGTGYLFRSPNNFHASTPAVFEGEFTGVPFNGEIAVPTEAGSFTSVGNPYPSNVSMTNLFAGNPDIDALYFWNNNHSAGNNYATCTGGLGCTAAAGGGNAPNDHISVGQGFIVKTEAASVGFDNTMRSGNTAVFFKGNENEIHKFRLNLNDVEGNGYNQILIGYASNATNGIDPSIDARLFNYEGSQIYNLIDEGKWVIQGRALPFELTDIVPLGFKAQEGGKFKISLEDYDGLFADEETEIYLKDKNLNITHNLKESDYGFESLAGEFKSRFEIVYKEDETMESDDLAVNSVQVYKQDQSIVVSSDSDKILSVEVYDLQGRVVYKKEKLNTFTHQFKSSAQGVLIIKAYTQSGNVLTRKLVN